MMENSKEISIIVTSYNNQKNLKKSIDSIYEKFSDFFDWEVIIVNNDEKQIISDFPLDFSKVKIIDHKKNVGFGGGINLGAKEASGEFLFILNPDTEVLTDNIAAVLDEFEKDNDLGIIGGGVVDERNRRQPWSAGKELSIYDLIRNNLGVSRSKMIWNSQEKSQCDWVSGTAMFIRKDLFDRLGGFDGRFFMYFEDMDLCKRAWSIGKKVLFFPRFQVFHRGGESYEDKRLQKKHYYDSMERYFEKNYNCFCQAVVKNIRKAIIRK